MKDPGTAGAPDEPIDYDEDRFLDKFSKRLRRCRSAWSDWREEVEKLYDTYASDPWPEQTKELMDEEGRPMATFNYALSTINAILGQDMADRKEARLEGQDGELGDVIDGYRAEKLTKAIRWVYQKCKGQRHETQAQYDQLITGYGWAESFIDVHRFPFRVAMRHVDCDEMHLDPDYKDDNASDARYIIRERKWLLEDAVARWPDAEEDLASAASKSGASSESSQVYPRPANFDGYQTSMGELAGPETEEDSIFIYDYQYRLKKWHVVFMNPASGKREELPEDEFEAAKKKLFAGEQAPPNLQSVRYMKEMFFRAHIAGDRQGGTIVLEDPKEIKERMFTYRCATGFRKKVKSRRTQHFGLMSIIYEPQLWSAKALSSAIEYLARGAKGGKLIKANVVADPQDFIENSSKPGYTGLANPEANFQTDIYELRSVTWHQGYDRLIEIAVEGMPQLSAVTDWVKGTASQERSNVLISNLQQQAMTVLNPIMDPMSQLRVENALMIGKLIQTYMSAEEFNKIVGVEPVEGVTHSPVPDPQTGEPQVDMKTGENVLQPIMIPEVGDDGAPIIDPQTGEPMQRPITPYDICKDADIFEYNVVVDLGSASTTAKQAVWQLFTQTALLQKLFEVNFPVEKLFSYLLKNMPGIPAEQAKRLSQEIKEELQEVRLQGTLEGVITALQSMPPENLQQVMGFAQQLLQEQMPEQEAAPAA